MIFIKSNRKHFWSRFFPVKENCHHMKIGKLAFVLLTFLSVMFFNGCSNAPKANGEHTVMIPNPFVYVSSMDEAAAGAGFDFICPQSVDGYSKKDISYIKNMLFQVVFSESDKKLYLRKARGNEDISGDYRSYNKTLLSKFGSYDITLKGRDDGFSVAIWSQANFSYAVTSDSPLSEEQIYFFVKNMK